MPTKTVYVTLVLCATVLFSCNSKKKNNAETVLSYSIADTIRLQASDAVEVSTYIQNFVQRITQQFTVPAKKVAVITAKNGLRITVDPATLQKEDGTAVDGKINVHIIELVNSNDLFKSNVATASNGRLLASGGSYFIGMDCGGQKISIKKGRAVQVAFPVIKKEPMELFYGEPDSSSNMNWVSAGAALQVNVTTPAPAEELQFTENNEAASDVPAFFMNENKQPRIFESLQSQVYFYGTLMTIKRLVDTVNSHQTRVFIDTVNMWPKLVTALLPGQRIDTHYLATVYGPEKQFIIRTCKARQEEAVRAAENAVKRQQALAQWKPQTLAGQLQKYYTPTAVRRLGWINCDRFYPYEEKTEVPMELPITFNKAGLQYFIIFRSFNGLLSGRIGGEDKKILADLPVNEPITLVAFSKCNGQVYQARQDLVIQKGQSIKLEMKNISAEEMTAQFGKNVRI